MRNFTKFSLALLISMVMLSSNAYARDPSMTNTDNITSSDSLIETKKDRTINLKIDLDEFSDERRPLEVLFLPTHCTSGKYAFANYIYKGFEDCETGFSFTVAEDGEYTFSLFEQSEVYFLVCTNDGADCEEDQDSIDILFASSRTFDITDKRESFNLSELSE